MWLLSVFYETLEVNTQAQRWIEQDEESKSVLHFLLMCYCMWEPDVVLYLDRRLWKSQPPVVLMLLCRALRPDAFHHFNLPSVGSDVILCFFIVISWSFCFITSHPVGNDRGLYMIVLGKETAPWLITFWRHWWFRFSWFTRVSVELLEMWHTFFSNTFSLVISHEHYGKTQRRTINTLLTSSIIHVLSMFISDPVGWLLDLDFLFCSFQKRKSSWWLASASGGIK